MASIEDLTQEEIKELNRIYRLPFAERSLMSMRRHAEQMAARERDKETGEPS
jgi:hypothetical protein